LSRVEFEGFSLEITFWAIARIYFAVEMHVLPSLGGLLAFALYPGRIRPVWWLLSFNFLFCLEGLDRL
jgi:hypothetical protein